LAHDVVLCWKRRFSRALSEIGIGNIGSMPNHHAPGVTHFPDMQGQCSGVDARDSGDSMSLKMLVNRSSRAGMAGVI
jgi:hypothetical protein